MDLRRRRVDLPQPRGKAPGVAKLPVAAL